MKKFLVGLVAASLVIGSAISVSAAPVDPATAEDGALIYTFNFKGEENVFTPDGSTTFKRDFTANVSEDGTAVTIKAKDGAAPSGNKNLWGGTLDKMELTAESAYTLVYKAKANGAANADNKLAVAGVLKNFSTLDAYSEILSNLGNYDTSAVNTYFSFSMGASPFGTAADAKVLTKGMAVDADGYMTVMVAYDGVSKKITTYVLSKDGNVTAEEDWTQVWQANGNPGKLAFMVHAHTKAVDTTIKDARIYKGVGYGKDPVVTPGDDDNTGNTGNTDNTGNAGNTDNKGNTAQVPTSPKTGDANTVIMPVLFLGSIVVAGYVLTIRKKYSK